MSGMLRRSVLLAALPVLAAAAALLVGCQWPGGEADAGGEAIKVGGTAPKPDTEDQRPADAPETAGEGADAATGTSGSSSQQTAADPSSSPVIADADEWIPPRPEDLSTGPSLKWREIEPIGEGSYNLRSTSDGRVVAWGYTGDGAGRAYVTDDGERWNAVRLPDGIRPSAIAVSADRWVVAGTPVSGGGDDGAVAPLSISMLGYDARAFLSDDQGATYAELRLDDGGAGPPLPEFAASVYNPAAIAMDGSTIVVAAIHQVFLDVPTLLADRGLVRSGETVTHWELADDALEVWFFDDPDDSGSAPVRGIGSMESDLRVPLDDLRLTPAQRELVDLNALQPQAVVFAGDGATLTRVAAFDAWSVVSAGGDDGFALILFSESGTELWTSPDGRTWDSQPSMTQDRASLSMPTLVDGVLWGVAPRTDGTAIVSSRIGEAAREVASFPGVQVFTHFDAGAAGFAVGAAVVSPVQVDASQPEALMPTGRIDKDGYELRFNEPEGGMTLWDLAADEAVYVLGPEAVQGSDTPEGVREGVGGDATSVAFDDPETGELLVVFTSEDLEPLLAPLVQTQLQDMADDWPEFWVGWSADGAAWGWQATDDAFGIEGLPTLTGLAVGADFVAAVVQDIGLAQDVDLRTAGAEDFNPWENLRTRWYIAPVP